RTRAVLAAVVLTSITVPALHSSATAAKPVDCTVTVNGVNLESATIPQLAAALRSGRLTSRQLTAAYIGRIKAFDHGTVKVNAIRTLTSDALAQADASDARRRLHQARSDYDGIPIILKDNVGTRDAPTTAGSIALARNVPKREATLVKALRAKGAVVLAKTNLSEFANWVDLRMPNGYSSLGGQVVNPYNGADPSGSSSGSGAGASLAYAAAAIGTETSGSILSPSDVESLVGIKPTVGLVSRTGVIPLAQSFDTAGPMARNVTDAAYLLQAIAGRDRTDSPYDEAPGGPPIRPEYVTALKAGALRGARLGYSPGDVSALPADQAAIFNRALDDLRGAGATLVGNNTLSNEANEGVGEIGLIPNEFKYGINHYLATEAGRGLPVRTLTGIVRYNHQHPDKVKYGQSLLQASDATPGIYREPTAIAGRTAVIEGSRHVIDSFLSDHHVDAYLTPGALYANIGAAAGYPTVIVPMGFVDNGTTPMGIGFLGHAWTERTLIGLAFDYERVSHRREIPTDVNPKLLAGVC
ncbi:MAG: amidase, partial [Frankiaceae bacterium]|nr:amidase [Frankiaceae bacterium]